MRKKSFTIYLLLTIIWTALIFLHSAMPATASNMESNKLLVIVQGILPWMTNGVLRKLAHFTEFAILGVFLTGTYWNTKRFLLARPLFCALFTALCDETLQLFVVGRSGQIGDVWIDFGGACLGTLVLWLILRLRRH